MAHVLSHRNNPVMFKSGLSTVELESYRGTVIEDGSGTSESKSGLVWMGLIKGQRPGNQLIFCIPPKERDEDLRLGSLRVWNEIA